MRTLAATGAPRLEDRQATDEENDALQAAWRLVDGREYMTPGEQRAGVSEVAEVALASVAEFGVRYLCPRDLCRADGTAHPCPICAGWGHVVRVR